MLKLHTVTVYTDFHGRDAKSRR